jgi:hypothetical protein
MNLNIRSTNFLRFQRMPDHKFREVLASSITSRVLQQKVPVCCYFFYYEFNFDFL